MPTLSAPNSATIQFDKPGGYLTVDCAVGSTAVVSWFGPGGTSGQRTVRNISEDVGPFIDGTTATVRATDGTCSYEQGGQSSVSGAGNLSSAGIALVLPPKIYARRDAEISVYFDALHEADNLQCAWDVSTVSGGTQQNERLRLIPDARHTGTALTISAIAPITGAVDVSATTALYAASPAAGAGESVIYLQIGDSTTANSGVITQTLLDHSVTDALTVTLTGTKGSGANKYEAAAGWSLADYCGASSPFWFGGALNFAQYLTANLLSTPNWVGIVLGTNDMLAPTTDAAALAAASSAFNGLDALIASIKAAGAGIKVALAPIAMPSSDQDGFGDNYGTAMPRWRFKRNAIIWNRLLLSRYSSQEASRVYIMPATMGMDNNNNALFAASAPANIRSAISLTRHNNGVHPASGGYQQIGDGIFAFLKCQAADTASAYSAERAVNGGFSADANWTKGAGWAIGGGVATATASNAPLTGSIGAYSAGAKFLLTYRVTAFSAGQFRAVIGGKAGGWMFGTGKMVEEIVTTSSGSTIDLYGAASFSGSIDDVSVRLVT
jgi:lysophospholipase L1-like esterase